MVWDAFDEKHNFKKPRYDYFKHLARLFKKYNLNDFKPSFPKLTTNDKRVNDNFATNGVGLFDEIGNYLMMIPKESERINVIIPKPEDGKIKVKWFNPFSGEYINHGPKDWSGWMEMISPWQFEMSFIIIEEE